MDTPTIAEYYREADPRKRKALLEQALASGEDMEQMGSAGKSGKPAIRMTEQMWQTAI